MTKEFRALIEKSNRIVFFGGAGVSTESGIPDFRSAAGLYNKKQEYDVPAEVMLSHTYFMHNTKSFYDMYKSSLLFPNAMPNKAHEALARLEQQGKLLGIITQNIDGLHQKAGSKNVVELHGTSFENYCMKCKKQYELDYIVKTEGVPKCECGGIIRPNVVLYEEGLDNEKIQKAIDLVENADLLIIGGTSLNVYPAAGLINYFNGDNIVLINKDKTPYDNKATLVYRDSIGEVLESVVDNG